MSFWRRPKGRHERGAVPRPVAAAEESVAVPGPRVELTFRDGSSAALDADTARALADVAQVLTRRD